MKHTIKFIIVLFSLVVTGTTSVWGITEDDIIVNVLPNSSAGTVTVAVSGMNVTITATPATDYFIDASHIIAEKMVDPSVSHHAPGLSSSLPISGSNPFTFTIPEGYTGAYVTVNFYKKSEGFIQITSLSEITDMDGKYQLTADVSGISSSLEEFKGTLDGGLHKIIGSSAPLFASTDGAIIRNIIFEDVNISSGDGDGDAGAVTSKAKGATRIYTCGILPTSVERDDKGKITGFYGSSVGGTRYVGSLVGFLDGTSRVINCYSYANVSGGSHVGGIVGYNNVATTATNLKTMVMNCMFYGDITGGTNVSPVYGGETINNLQGGLNNFNYYAYTQLKTATINKYNCALSVEDKFLNRFEYYRLLLNSNKKLAAFYATGSHDNAKQMAKWVLETADRSINGRDPYPFPILKAQGYYPSIINPDITNAPDSASVGRNHGGKLGKTLSVTIATSKSDGGQTWPTGASITKNSLTLQRTDKDFDRFNFNYDKVQLPYYDEVGTGNYTDNKVVTGWKITVITPVAGDPYTAANYPTTGVKDFPDHNYADRKSSKKDLYSVSKRVFSQGAYFDVPYGVTAITIEPYWANAIYVADANYDVVYKNDYTGKQNVSQTGAQITTFNEQSVKNSIPTLSSAATVYDNAVVLVGNFHLDGVPSGGDIPFTMMSVDEDNDHEPDYSLIYHHKDRTSIAPIRFDFLNIPGTAQAQKPNGASKICNFTIFKTKGWFEVTNTSSFYTSQLEYENQASLTKSDAPLILLGGVIDQFVSTQSSSVDGHTIYIHLGSNVWINEFGMGTHSDGSQSTPHVPVSVTGGEFPGFYLTGTYKADAQVRTDNAECYISGGYIHEAAGASLEQIDGSVHWQIYNADIDNFFGGGINDAKPITGNVTTDIFNSYVTLFCGGPKFGNMQGGKKVTTNAEGCTFGKFFGAGYGGTSIAKKKYYDKDGEQNWSTLQGYYTTDRGKYFDGTTTQSSQTGKDYGRKGPGVATDFDYEFFVWTSGLTGARLYVKFASFSLAQCNDVLSTLKKCTVETNFYGGGNLGKVVGTATSKLEDCTVKGSVYGAGYSASIPTVEVRDAGFTKNPNYNSQSGMFEPGVFSGTTTFTWQNAAAAGKPLTNGQSGSDLSNHILYTNTVLTGLGEVAKAVLSIDGTTTVLESVYGGGEESGVGGDTEVKVTGGTIGTENLGGAEYGNVYGGGKGKADDVTAGIVKGSTTVSISGSPTILHNVYGGGAYGSVGTFTYADNDYHTAHPEVPVGMPYALATENTGACTVTITGGTIGTTGKENGMVFGSSRGDVGQPGGITDKQAWVHQTHVTIGDANAETGPTIKGSVYGGGENGHTFTDALVEIKKGTIGITDTQIDGGAAYAYRGNVYGGGCGTDTYEIDHDDDDSTPAKIYFNRLAGIVRGNTEVNITGGHVVHNVYGGGAMGSVGLFTREASNDIHMPGKITSVTSNTGKCTVTVSGGTVGNTGAKMINETGGPDDFGHVFGAGRGEVQALADYPNLERVIYVDNTDVTISGGLVTGSVYGGSESGHVLGNTVVKIQGGQIGCGVGQTVAYTDTDWSATSLNPTAHWTYSGDHSPYDQYASTAGKYDYTNFTNIPEADRRSTSEGGRPTATDGHTFFGNVFGGGSGYYPYAPGYWLRSAGQVGGTATVTISGGHILNNVYGGCEMADIEGAVTVTMTGGTVGVPRTKAEIEALPTLGHIYGAGMGDKRIFFNTSTNVAQTTVSVSGGTVYGSVYGGGEDGHVLGNTTTTISQAANKTTVIGCDGKSGYDGNVFGGGQGSVTAKTAGVVAGDVVVNIEGGTMKGSVYGGGRLASVGTYFAMANHANYGKMQADVEDDTSTTEVNEAESHGHIKVNLTGGTIHQNVYGGCMGTTDAGDDSEDYGVSKTVEVNLNKPQCKGKDADNIGTASGCAVKGDIFGCNNTNASPQQTVTVHVYGTQNAAKNDIVTKFFKATADLDNIGTLSTIKESIASLNAASENAKTEQETAYDTNLANYNKEGATDAEKQTALANIKKIILFATADELGLDISTDKATLDDTEATATQKQTALENIKKAINDSKYDVHAVYGGGNLAAYTPIGPNPTTTSDDGQNTTYSTNVIIDGCGLTSIQNVYGGGNAASTPATNLTVNGTYEIEEVFGGGNGKDNLPNGDPNPGANVGFKDYSAEEETYNTKEKRTEGAEGAAFIAKYVYGSGKAAVNIFGGTIHRVFGGSNTKGNVRQTAVTLLDESSGCDFCVDEAYGGGKSAPMDAEAKLHMACIPGLQAAYGGAEAAAIQGNVTLNITNGTFDRVFGGNNLSGTIKGSITVNIEEVGCKPIKIGELYGGGNQAGYSVYGYDSKDKPIEKGDDPLYDDPQVNVKSFTSIGNIYGGGFGTGATMVGNPTVNINEAYGRYYNDDSSEVGDNAETPNHYPIPSHAKGKIGAINNVFGGGNAAKVIGNTAVNIAIIEEVYVVKEVAAGASVIGYYTRSGKGTTADPFVYTALTTGTAVDGTTYYEKKDVMGVDIRGNVYGGGNNAEVTGNTNVTIGKQETTTTIP
nr:hypothetical protein [uncultured Prevotella sp.]